MRTPFVLKLSLALALSLGFIPKSYATGDMCAAFIRTEIGVEKLVGPDLVLKTETDGELSLLAKYRDIIRSNLVERSRKLRTISRIVRDPQEGMLIKLKMIKKALYTIHTSYYILEKDMASYGYLDGLKQAVTRGVDVYLTIDSLGSPDKTGRQNLKALLQYANKNAGYKLDPNDPTKKLDEKAQIKIAIFNPVNPRTMLDQEFTNIYRRMHNVEVDLAGEYDSLKSWVKKHSGNREKISEEFDEYYASVEQTPLTPLKKMILVKDWFNRRSHNKELLIDGAHFKLASYIDGGRNIGNDYYDLPQVNNGTFHDVETLTQNDQSLPPEDRERNHIGSVLIPFLNQLHWNPGNQLIYNGLIDRAFALVSGSFRKEITKMENATNQFETTPELIAKFAAMNDPNNDYMDPKNSHKGAWTHLDEIENIRRHHGDMDAGVQGMAQSVNRQYINGSSIIAHVHARVMAAKKSVKICSPYADFTEEEIAYIKQIAARGIKVEILSNSIMTSDNMPAQVIVDKKVGPAFAGIENITVYEYGKSDAVTLGGTKPYGKLHAKFIIVDDEWVFNGTWNGDPRSRNLNSETFQKIRSIGLGKDFADFYDYLTSSSHVFGSPEYLAIRTNPKLGKMKLTVAAHQGTLDEIINYLHLEWML